MTIYDRILDEDTRVVLWRIDAYLRKTGQRDLRIYERPADGPYAEIVYRFWLEGTRLVGQVDVTLQPEIALRGLRVTQIS